MALTVLLAKVLGLFLVIVGAAIMLRRRYFLPVFGVYPEQRLVRAVVSMAQLLAGLFLIVMHNVWWPLPAALINCRQPIPKAKLASQNRDERAILHLRQPQIRSWRTEDSS